jgi:hypothetical protein
MCKMYASLSLRAHLPTSRPPVKGLDHLWSKQGIGVKQARDTDLDSARLYRMTISLRVQPLRFAAWSAGFARVATTTYGETQAYNYFNQKWTS